MSDPFLEGIMKHKTPDWAKEPMTTPRTEAVTDERINPESDAEIVRAALGAFSPNEGIQLTATVWGPIYRALQAHVAAISTVDAPATQQEGVPRITGPDAHGSMYVYLYGSIEPGGAATTLQHDSLVNLDYDKDGKLIGIELLSVSPMLAPPKTGTQATTADAQIIPEGVAPPAERDVPATGEQECPDWVCLECGAINDCKGITYNTPGEPMEYDTQCNQCGGLDFAESMPEAIRILAARLDTAKAAAPAASVEGKA